MEVGVGLPLIFQLVFHRAEAEERRLQIALVIAALSSEKKDVFLGELLVDWGFELDYHYLFGSRLDSIMESV